MSLLALQYLKWKKQASMRAYGNSICIAVMTAFLGIRQQQKLNDLKLVK
jgi:hypothetical protein